MPAIALLSLLFILNLLFTDLGVFFPLDFIHFLNFVGKWCAIAAIALAVGWCFGD